MLKKSYVFWRFPKHGAAFNSLYILYVGSATLWKLNGFNASRFRPLGAACCEPRFWGRQKNIKDERCDVSACKRRPQGMNECNTFTGPSKATSVYRHLQERSKWKLKAMHKKITASLTTSLLLLTKFSEIHSNTAAQDCFFKLFFFLKNEHCLVFAHVELEFCGEAARSKGGDAARRFCEVSHSRDLHRKKHRVTLFFDIFRYYSYLLYNMHDIIDYNCMIDIFSLAFEILHRNPDFCHRLLSLLYFGCSSMVASIIYHSSNLGQNARGRFVFFFNVLHFHL